MDGELAIILVSPENGCIGTIEKEIVILRLKKEGDRQQQRAEEEKQRANLQQERADRPATKG